MPLRDIDIHSHMTALRERVKELTCLYSLAQLADRPNITLDCLLQGIAELLPPAWQYPEIAAGCILFDERLYATANFRDGDSSQTAALIVNDERRGFVKVVYLEKKPELDEGPFLKEERNLIDTLAKQISLVLQRRQSQEEKKRFQEQLRHADRLATIGQLAAGVAHELNEPLVTILGFAQLVEKQAGLPEQTIRDLGKIIDTALHAREIVKKLMLFARQMPPRMLWVNLNAIIGDALSLFESRCAKQNIALVQKTASELPEITADPSQMRQLLVNLVVNAIQAMPAGGVLTVSTSFQENQVLLIVEDNGVGMSEEVRKQLFIPFFTTKDINEGTGLGLPVVHGIVTSHGGTITVESSLGRGSRFEIRLPCMAVESAKDFEDGVTV